jgi:hypothetical protein
VEYNVYTNGMCRCQSDYCEALSGADEAARAAEVSAVLCATLTAYSQQCGAVGVVLEWRTAQLCRE